MARMSGNGKRSGRYFGDSLQFTNWVLDSGETCHMTPQVSDFIPGSFEDTDKYIEVADGHHVTAKQKGQVQIIMCDDNGDNFIATLHNVLLAPDLCNGLFLIAKLINLGHTFLLHKGFCTVYFSDKKKNTVTLPHSAQRKHTFLVKTKEKYKSKKLSPINKVSLGLLHHILGHRYTISLMAGDTANFWQDIELRIDPDPFCTSYQISSMNEKSGSKNPLKPKAHFKWVLWTLFHQHPQKCDK